MENKSNLTKWVWLGGAAIIGIIVISQAFGGGSSGSGAADLAAVTNLNAIGAQLSAKQTDSYTQLGLAKYQLDASVASGFFTTLQNMDNNSSRLAAEFNQANAGIVNSIVTGGTAIAVDSITQQAKTQQTEIAADAAYQIAQANANAAIAASKAQEHSSIFGSIAKTVGNIAGGVLAL